MNQTTLFSQTTEQGEACLEALRKSAQGCTACPLGQSRTQTVFGAGNANRPAIMFVGDSPGQAEDESGAPFVGPAGQLLTKMIGALGFTREQVYLTTMVLCRVTENRSPSLLELQSCHRFLRGQIQAVRPRTLVLLGASASEALLRTGQAFLKLRGKWHEYEGVPTRVTFHPAYLMRNPTFKARAWQDLQEARAYWNSHKSAD
jgi:uracil-DNA glycosylase